MWPEVEIGGGGATAPMVGDDGIEFRIRFFIKKEKAILKILIAFLHNRSSDVEFEITIPCFKNNLLMMMRNFGVGGEEFWGAGVKIFCGGGEILEGGERRKKVVVGGFF
ncbi:hypothetical protein LIER_06708 [Lithospermum erythrorhizon]|uniref:Uncharacterized protein n=1 Tax=Lithospermum erythrorhizon TaxID=34254 RepID=A0AAV3P6W7_LITER